MAVAFCLWLTGSSEEVLIHTIDAEAGTATATSQLDQGVYNIPWTIF